MNSKPTIEIGIPAYNEAVNIVPLLQSLFTQNLHGLKLLQITVYSDASTDATTDLVNQFSLTHPQVKLIQGVNRKGKYYRVNQAFSRCHSEILVILDADIAIKDSHFLHRLVKPIMSDSNALVVAAGQLPCRPSNFIGKVLYTYLILWDFIRHCIPNQNNAQNFFGAATAFRGTFCRNLHIPDGLLDPHMFIYLSAAQHQGFRYNPLAQIYYWPFSSINELRIFLKRSLGKYDPFLAQKFTDLYTQKLHIPFWCKLSGLTRCFFKEPLFTPLALVLKLAMDKLWVPKQHDSKPIWDVLTSTKKPL